MKWVEFSLLMLVEDEKETNRILNKLVSDYAKNEAQVTYREAALAAKANL